MGLLLLHAGFEAAALDHETVDDAVENGAVVEAFLDVSQEIGGADRRFFRVQGDDDVTLIGLQFDAGLIAHDGGSLSCR